MSSLLKSPASEETVCVFWWLHVFLSGSWTWDGKWAEGRGGGGAEKGLACLGACHMARTWSPRVVPACTIKATAPMMFKRQAPQATVA